MRVSSLRCGIHVGLFKGCGALIRVGGEFCRTFGVFDRRKIINDEQRRREADRRRRKGDDSL